ncbi:MAG: hypothetical protein RJB26_2317, partial [Pseudomonadota bacterium]
MIATEVAFSRAPVTLFFHPAKPGETGRTPHGTVPGRSVCCARKQEQRLQIIPMEFMNLKRTAGITPRVSRGGTSRLGGRLAGRWLALLAGLVLLWPAAAPRAEDDFIPPEQAFKYTVSATPAAITVEWKVTAGYYLYRKRIGFESGTPGITLGTPVFPKGVDHEDEFFGKQEVYRGAGNRFVLPYTRTGNGPANAAVVLKLQGCADAGLCYPPMKWTASVVLPPPAPPV